MLLLTHTNDGRTERHETLRDAVNAAVDAYRTVTVTVTIDGEHKWTPLPDDVLERDEVVEVRRDGVLVATVSVNE